MKKLLLLSATVLSCYAGNAQKISTTSADPYLLRKGDRLILNNNGREAAVDADFIYKDGSRIKTDGSVINAAGKKRMLRDGEIVPAKAVLITTYDRDKAKVRLYR